MGKRIRVQRRGRGGPTFQASTEKRIAPVKYSPMGDPQASGVVEGCIEKLLHEPGRGSPLARVKLETGGTYHFVAPEGLCEGQTIQVGSQATSEIGNVLPLGNIAEGTMICCIELSPGDGGKMVRSSGTYATVIAHTPQGTQLRLPSGKAKYVNDSCRATIGVASGAGRLEKPLLKAGTEYHRKKAKGHKYPRTRGRAMVAAAHPFGSSKRGGRRASTVGRGAPPGKKVGLIAARSTGKKKKRRR